MPHGMSRQLTFGPPIDRLLDRLYELHTSQDAALGEYFSARAAEGSLDFNSFDERTNVFLRDKLIALDPVKAEFCYQLCRALRATRVIEAGTSFGVSTIHLALAVRDNARDAQTRGADAIVIATEHEPDKAQRARAHFREAGVADLIDLREGAVVVCDNTEQFRDAYAEYFEFIRDRRNRLQTLTLPYPGGLEFTVRV